MTSHLTCWQNRWRSEGRLPVSTKGTGISTWWETKPDLFGWFTSVPTKQRSILCIFSLKAPEPSCRKGWWQMALGPSRIPSSLVSLVWSVPKQNLGNPRAVDKPGYSPLLCKGGLAHDWMTHVHILWWSPRWQWLAAGRDLLSGRWCLSLAEEALPAETSGALSIPLIKTTINEHLFVMAKWSCSTSTHLVLLDVSAFPSKWAFLRQVSLFPWTPIIMSQTRHSRIWTVWHWLMQRYKLLLHCLHHGVCSVSIVSLQGSHFLSSPLHATITFLVRKIT